MTKYARKVIQIKATDSPNVRHAMEQQAQGLVPTDQAVIPGVLTWSEYQQRRATWDPIRQCIGLDAQFWEGADALMFPPMWLGQAEQVANELRASGVGRRALAMGIDPGEGSANTAWCIVDQLGVVDLLTKPTLDTTVITAQTIVLMQRYGLTPGRVAFDRGGGGKQHADRLRQQGYNVQTVAFGEGLTPMPRQQLNRPPYPNRVEDREAKYTYKNRRAEMYGTLRQLIDPGEGPVPGVTATVVGGRFGLPPWYPQFRQQLAPIPLLYDAEGRLEMLPKSKRQDQKSTDRKTLVELIGHSPDEADALVLAVYAMLKLPGKVRAGALGAR